MRNNDIDLIALLTKGQHDLRTRFDALARQPGPQGERGADGKDGRDGRDGTNGKDGRNGIDGAPGQDGKDGRNGDDGLPGARGAQGPQGEVGPRGAKGEKGEKGDTGPMPDHEWQGTKLRFEKPDGKWGKYVDLKGERGTSGTGTSASVGGGWSLDPESFPLVDTIEPLDEMVVVRAGEFVRVRVVLQSGEVPANAVTVNGEAVTVNGQFVLVAP